MNKKFKSILLRFVKAGLTGGAVSVSLALSQAPSLNTLADLKTWLLALAMAFASGAIMAIEKSANWQPSQTN